MLCQNCKKRTATVEWVAEINGQKVVCRFCDVCAGEISKASYSSASAESRKGEPAEGADSDEMICPACGMSFSEFRRTGLLGCPSCYDSFHDWLMPYISRIQGKTRHVGKAGGFNTEEHDVMLRLSRLQEKMEDALANGDYELAGKINEQMSAIKKKPDGEGGWQW